VEFDDLLRYGAAAVVGSLVLIGGLGLSLQADLRLRRFYVPFVVLLVVLVPAAIILVTMRDVTAVDFDALERAGERATTFLRLCTLALVGLTAVRLLARLLERTPPVRGAGVLLVSFVAFMAGNYVLNAVFGSDPAPPGNQTIYAALAMLGLFVSREPDLRMVVMPAKWGVMLVMLASLAVLVVMPGLVRQVQGAELRIPGIGFRLFGLSANPNSMATVAVVGLLLSVYMPFRQRALEALNVAATVAVLALAQSQTAWLAAAVTLPVLLLFRKPARFFDRRSLLWAMATVTLAGVGIAVLGTRFEGGLTVAEIASGDRYRQLVTLTGRTAIWDVAVREWLDNVLFGHGPTIWGEAFRERVGMGYAFTAHNQFLQSLSSAGMVGLLTLVGYLGVLFVLSATAPRPQRGLAMALLALIVARVMTETPLHVATPFSHDFLPHFLLFGVLACAHSKFRIGTVPDRRYGPAQLHARPVG
jgi:O-antigen ligase